MEIYILHRDVVNSQSLLIGHSVKGTDDVPKNNTYHNNNDESVNVVVVIMVGCWAKGNPKTLFMILRESVQFAWIFLWIDFSESVT